MEKVYSSYLLFEGWEKYENSIHNDFDGLDERAEPK